MRKIFLLVDDDPLANLINRRFLEHAIGHQEIYTFGSAYEGILFLKTLDSIENHEVVIFLDINMPGMNGWDFLRELNREFAGQKFYVYVLSSSADPEDKEKAESFKHVKSYIFKPLTKDKILELNLI